MQAAAEEVALAAEPLAAAPAHQMLSGAHGLLRQLAAAGSVGDLASFSEDLARLQAWTEEAQAAAHGLIDRSAVAPPISEEAGCVTPAAATLGAPTDLRAELVPASAPPSAGRSGPAGWSTFVAQRTQAELSGESRASAAATPHKKTRWSEQVDEVEMEALMKGTGPLVVDTGLACNGGSGQF